MQLRQFKFMLLKYLCLSCALRGIAFAIRASTVADGSSTGRTIAYIIMQGSGFGLAIIVQCIALCGW